MKFDLKRPCKLCPFKNDCLEGWLGKERAQEIIDCMVKEDGHFTCHETSQFDDETGEPIMGKKSQHCAGAMILLEKNNRANQFMRIAERLGIYDRTKLDMDAPVFNTYREFVNRHAAK